MTYQLNKSITKASKKHAVRAAWTRVYERSNFNQDELAGRSLADAKWDVSREMYAAGFQAAANAIYRISDRNFHIFAGTLSN